MIKEKLAISDFMPSEEKCFEHLRRTRWHKWCGLPEMWLQRNEEERD